MLKVVYKNKTMAMKILKINPNNVISYNKFLDLLKESGNLIFLSKNLRLIKIYAISLDINLLEEIIKGDVLSYITSPPYILMEYMEGKF